jgi:hypothetical protein
MSAQSEPARSSQKVPFNPDDYRPKADHEVYSAALAR